VRRAVFPIAGRHHGARENLGAHADFSFAFQCFRASLLRACMDPRRLAKHPSRAAFRSRAG